MAPRFFLLRLFTWWNRQTFGTWLFTLREGREVGRDVFGNIYYQSKSGKRWVIYPGTIEASSVPLQWSAWLQGRAEHPPLASIPHYRWEKPHQPNKTGTPEAYHPPGSLLGSAQVPQGDYEPWVPHSEQRTFS